MSRGYAAIGLVCPKNKVNIGGVFRAAHCYGASLLLVERPRLPREASDVTNATKHIPTITGPILDHRPHNCEMVVVEIVENAISLPDFTHPERALYVFGPEDGSVPAEMIARAQHVVAVPTAYCMNLAATVNVVLYDRMAKRLQRLTLERSLRGGV